MLGSIRGKVISKTDKFAIVEAGGVGYKVKLAPNSLPTTKEGEEVFLWIHTHAREDALDLFGFVNYPELEFFEMLIAVSGIGPKGALAVLSVAPTNTLRAAISAGDTGYLTKVSGIGKKTAERIVIELRDKMGVEKETGGDLSRRDELDALEALKSLGYAQNEAREALKKVPGGSTAEKVKDALKILANK